MILQALLCSEIVRLPQVLKLAAIALFEDFVIIYANAMDRVDYSLNF